jgi:bifunctional UDP-N-acetylglucosamine pyrophosphorylase/glucosamine-1-phosphate N-acetyltransferase
MAAGQGTRMRSDLPKVLHPVCGRPMILWPVMAASAAGADRIVVVVSPDRDLGDVLPDGVETVIQPESDGTGGAARAAIEQIGETDEVVILSGDVPLLSAEVIGDLLEEHRRQDASATVLTAILDDPASYGRVIRAQDGSIEKIVEAKTDGDGTPEELAVREINSGTYVFRAEALAEALPGLENHNSQGEYYLPDALTAIGRSGGRVIAWTSDDRAVNMGVNDRVDLASVEGEARRRIARAHQLAGVTVVDPDSTWIDADVTIGRDARIEPGCSLKGATEIGEEAVIGPLTTVTDCGIGARSSVVHSVLNLCEVLEGCEVGPFAYLRPGARLEDGSKAGTFVEVKNSVLGPGAKVPHLSYVGDADVGEGANLGAGTITANYDGIRKHRTVIGPGVRIGVDTMLVAPVTVGAEAVTGAGAVIREDVPPGSLSVSENLQRNIEGYTEDLEAQESEKDQTERPEQA